MPMIDAFIPEGALAPDAEERLFKELTDILLRLEGLDPAIQKARDVTVLFLHRPKVFVAGLPPASPLYRFIPSVPEGQYDDRSRRAVVKEMTEAVARAEGGTFEEVSPRVWVFPNEIADGRWGSRGVIRKLPDILAYLVGEHERPLAEARLARRRRENAVAMLEAAPDVARGGAGKA